MIVSIYIRVGTRRHRSCGKASTLKGRSLQLSAAHVCMQVMQQRHSASHASLSLARTEVHAVGSEFSFFDRSDAENNDINMRTVFMGQSSGTFCAEARAAGIQVIRSVRVCAAASAHICPTLTRTAAQSSPLDYRPSNSVRVVQ